MIISLRSAGTLLVNVYLKKAHSTGSPDLCSPHWPGTLCRMNSLASASLSPVAHRSKMSKTGLSMQFLTMKRYDLGIMGNTKKKRAEIGIPVNENCT